MNTKIHEMDIIDGFSMVSRQNNPKRQYAMVHNDLGKIGPVFPQEAIKLVKDMIQGGIEFGRGPIIGLSESSILLGRMVSEFITHSSFIFSSRYASTGMVAFSEPHSHAPVQYLKLDLIKDASEVCIMEDEITSGNTILNLIQTLLDEMPNLVNLRVVSLKMLCQDYRIKELENIISELGVKVSFASLYRGSNGEIDPLAPKSTLKAPNNLQPFNSNLEIGRGRTKLFSGPEVRQALWEPLLDILPANVCIIGVSEAIDMAFEISYFLTAHGRASTFRQLTISPWELPGWVFPGFQPLHLYYPPDKGGVYLIVYDQPAQKDQVYMLKSRLLDQESQVYVMGPEMDGSL
ncbi:MAG: phosphoribosyltransferase domain-containing protein [Desulfitobacteriaceae bacterium]|nr:phosphoribosyltransferase domain-containing protein [Clostridia bacterium]MDD4401759.1 phosphoribosyltransferase domain-containing protein [Desulfitobacteriaceae bacterium]